jgi:2,3-bisphosphoglycerate-independent phosphoglycerate mutase
MSAPAVTDRAIEAIGDDPALLVLNYANPDMVGHTGDFDAAVAAVEAVDRELGRLAEALRGAGADVLVTADHGNADDMGTPEAPHTAHTTNPVPAIYVAPDGTGGGRGIRSGGTLADVAPTLLALLGLDRPPAMTGRSLLD